MTKRLAKIAVLEWICGGGLLDIPSEQVDGGLRAEGLAMLSTLASGLTAEMEVVVPLDLRLVSTADLDPRAQVVDVLDPSYEAHSGAQHPLPQWAAMAEQCDAVWVIAPEIDSALSRSVDYLRGCGRKLLNCRGDFLRQCSDKRSTSKRLLAAGIPHPPTRDLEQIDQAWLNSTTANCSAPAQPYWIVKPTAGAGGAGQRLVNQEQLRQLVQAAQAGFSGGSQTTQSVEQIVQPWMPGRPASCSVIVDALGRRHWLPLVSQDFAQPKSKCGSCGPHDYFDQSSRYMRSPPQYIGCTYPCNELPSGSLMDAPRELLENTLDAFGPGAYGPVGIDLLYNASTQAWTVIEVNARCTSSLVGLAQAYRGELALDIFKLLYRAEQNRQFADFTTSFNPFQFRIPRDTDEPA